LIYLGILPATCHFQYINNQWPYLDKNNIHSSREDIQWLSIQHSIIDQKQMQTENLSIINSIISNQCNIGQNVTIHNSIVGNRVTLGDNCCIQSVDFSKEVKKNCFFSKIDFFVEFSFINSI
jgi:NDP-sugar pyrophosphorylase family protein